MTSLYIDHNSKHERLAKQGKADALIADGALEVEQPTTYVQGGDTDLVVVAANAGFDAAYYLADVADFERVVRSKAAGDARPYRWLRYRHARAVIEWQAKNAN